MHDQCEYSYVVLSLLILICDVADELGWLLKTYHDSVMKRQDVIEDFETSLCAEVEQIMLLHANNMLYVYVILK